MAEVAVVIPYRGGEAHRDRNMVWVLDRYLADHDTFVADCDGRWSKGAAIANAIALTDAGILVIADADSFTTAEAITEATSLVADGAPWVVPHGNVYRLTDAATVAVLDGGQPSKRHLVRAAYEGPAGGGITVVAREVYEQVPVDHRFYEWGGEDIAWAHALRTLVGEPHRIGADLFHLWHPHPSPDYAKPPESEALLGAYIDARNHPARMRSVVAGEPYEPPPPCAPRTFRSAKSPRTLHVGPERVRFRDHLFTTTDPDIAEAVARFPNVEEVEA